MFGGSILVPEERWYPQTKSKYLSLKYLMTSKNTGLICYAVQKLIFGVAILGGPKRVLPPNYVKVFVSVLFLDFKDVAP